MWSPQHVLPNLPKTGRRTMFAVASAIMLCMILYLARLNQFVPSRIDLHALRIHQQKSMWTKAQVSRIKHLDEIAKWSKPQNMTITALVFYGRKRYVEILECYLRRNLVRNGGILDKVVFVAKTDNEEDLQYLQELVQNNEDYTSERHREKGLNFSQMYGSCHEGAICVKIDDDVLFMEDTTIPSIVKKKLDHPEYIGVSANLVNNFATTWIHWHLGALHSYLPDYNYSVENEPTAPTDWRVTNLPHWDGDEHFDLGKVEQNFTDRPGHRWLPVKAGHPMNRETPITKAHQEYGDGGWHTWMVGAQEHYSFFENLEKDELWRYNLETWDNKGIRVGLNLFAFSGDDLKAYGPIPPADEQFWTMDKPVETGKPFVIDGHGMAVHFGYRRQTKKDDKDLRMEATDILSRYKRYAEENIC